MMCCVATGLCICIQEWKTDFLYFYNVCGLKKLNWKIEALSFSHKQEMSLCILAGTINFLKEILNFEIIFSFKLWTVKHCQMDNSFKFKKTQKKPEKNPNKQTKNPKTNK